MPDFDPNDPATEELRHILDAARTPKGEARRAYVRAHSVSMFREVTEIDGQTVESVRMDFDGTTYRVVPLRIDGRPALHSYSEEATRGQALASDPAPLGRNRDYLARLALTFLESGMDASFMQPISRLYPERRRPSDEALLNAVRDAAAHGKSARQDLATVYGVSVNTADDWIKHARGLPGAGLPPPRRGRPRKHPDIPVRPNESDR